MKIKNILTTCLVCCGLAAVLTGCSKDDDPFFSANENDAPRILNTDLPEGKGGTPATIATIDRTQNFTYELIVTPAHYTTVKWYIDEEEVAEGLTIDVPVLAGEHIVKIVATTTQGKSTSRTCKLTVRSIAGDPELATDAKSRWLTIGSTMTIDCANATNVTKVFIGKYEATNVKFENGKLSFDIPEMEAGEYQVTIEVDGVKYGCSVFTVSNEAYPETGIKETVLWEGDTDINWGDSNVFLSAGDLADVPVGATISLEYEITEATYHALRITNQDWSADIVPQVDGFENQPNPYEFTYTANHKAIADDKGMLITGFGYKMKKVTYK